MCLVSKWTHVFRTESWLRPPIGVRLTTSSKFFLGFLKKAVDTALRKVYHTGYGMLRRSLHHCAGVPPALARISAPIVLLFPSASLSLLSSITLGNRL